MEKNIVKKLPKQRPEKRPKVITQQTTSLSLKQQYYNKLVNYTPILPKHKTNEEKELVLSGKDVVFQRIFTIWAK